MSFSVYSLVQHCYDRAFFQTEKLLTSDVGSIRKFIL